MKPAEEIQFREAMHREDFSEAQNICQRIIDVQRNALINDLALAVFFIDLETSSLKKENPGLEINCEQVLLSLGKKIEGQIKNIINSSTEQEANASRTKALRYSQAELLLKMLFDGEWNTEAWHFSALLAQTMYRMVKRVEKPISHEDSLAVSWDGWTDEPSFDGSESGEHKRLLVEV